MFKVSPFLGPYILNKGKYKIRFIKFYLMND